MDIVTTRPQGILDPVVGYLVMLLYIISKFLDCKMPTIGKVFCVFLTATGLCMVVCLATALIVLEYAMDFFGGGEWPEDQSRLAYNRFNDKREQLLAAGDGEKAKETFAVQELQDLIFSKLNTAQLYKLQRVSKQWKCATTDNSDCQNIQIAMHKKQDPARKGEWDWTPELKRLFTSKDDSTRSILIAGAFMDFILTENSMVHGDPRRPLNKGPRLVVEMQMKGKANKPSTSLGGQAQPLASIIEDSRIDMVIFSSPMADILTIEMTDNDLDDRLWELTVRHRSGIPRNQPSSRGDHSVTTTYACSSLREKWRSSGLFDGDHDELLDVSLLRMLCELEVYFLAQREEYLDVKKRQQGGDWFATKSLKGYRCYQNIVWKSV